MESVAYESRYTHKEYPITVQTHSEIFVNKNDPEVSSHEGLLN